MKKKHTLYSLIFLTLTVFQSCTSDRNEPVPIEVPVPGYLELAVSTSATLPTRGNPTGGELGDGYEHGREKENSIYNLSVFLYVDGGSGLDGDYVFQWKKYADNQVIENDAPEHPNDRIYTVRLPLTQQEVDRLGSIAGTMRLAVIANAGDVTMRFSNTKSLVRDVSYGMAWEGNSVAEADCFLMAPAFNGAKHGDKKDGLVTKTEDSKNGVLYNGEVNLERVAARIDLHVTTENIVGEDASRSIQYKVGGTQNRLTITNAIPVNQMQNQSFLVKQVAAEYNSESGWLSAGDELTNGTTPDLKPTNYVITPQFGNKPAKIEGYFSTWYGNSRASWLRDPNNLNALAAMSVLSPGVVNRAYQFEGAGDNERAIVLTYANENTHHESVQLSATNDGVTSQPSDYLTGLLFRTQYHPAKLYVDGELQNTTEYKEGDDFWMFRTVEAEVNEAKNIYFSSEAALDAYVATLPAGGRYETQKYDNGICYYNIWIKHANIEADPEENFPMKYGIVRNNIYRISLNFHGIGQPTPEITEPYGVTSRIFVIKWNFRPQPEIIM